MARPVHANAEATCQRILEAASHLFGERGMDGVSIRAIAAEAGVTLATVHFHFGTKDRLYQACVDGMYGDLRAMTLEILGGVDQSDPLAGIGPIVRRSYGFALAHRGAIRLLMRTVMQEGELRSRERLQHQRPLLDAGCLPLMGVLDLSEPDVRLILQSVIHLVVRYALSSPGELAFLTGIEGDVEAADARVEDHLVAVAEALFTVSMGGRA